ncbi:hypothetical protein FACS1894187_01290 [Synergistales bacterium]|nr:hypothetical protein FACS1894187_01290 [Synergistales bacterium]
MAPVFGGAPTTKLFNPCFPEKVFPELLPIKQPDNSDNNGRKFKFYIIIITKRGMANEKTKNQYNGA